MPAHRHWHRAATVGVDFSRQNGKELPGMSSWSPAAIAYSKTFGDGRAHDLFLRAVDAPGSCVAVAGDASIRDVFLSGMGRHTFWTEDQGDDSRDEFIAATASCLATRISPAVSYFQSVAEEGYIWSQTAADRGSWTLLLDQEELPSKATVIDTATGPIFTYLRTEAAVAYAVQFDNARPGLYIATKLPFGRQ
jgi:hypothetical protein